ncbi:MAG: hypothetical protein EZS28_013716 [Streblomastix strix]|uniref:Uncharacterized protein n=1 Tax=Streblomastix strix TaxID=222440 RepID=A0A5J4W7H5_9EUKA|nr:MAG: hypothetical protein EZS28_013716 [Streblomastix strix]
MLKVGWNAWNDNDEIRTLLCQTLIPDSISQRLKDLKSIADKPENDKTHVLTECKNVEIVELGKEGRLRVCGLGVSDIRVIVECVEPLVVVLQNIGQK